MPDLVGNSEDRFSHNEAHFTSSEDATVYAQIHSNGNDTIQKGEKAIFKSPIANVGSAYSNDTGIFEAPVDGTYYFSATLCLHQSDVYTYFLIVHDGVKLAKGLTGNPNWSDCDTVSAAAYMRKGSQVWVEYGDTSTSIYGRNFAVAIDHSFTAVLINTNVNLEN